MRSVAYWDCKAVNLSPKIMMYDSVNSWTYIIEYLFPPVSSMLSLCQGSQTEVAITKGPLRPILSQCVCITSLEANYRLIPINHTLRASMAEESYLFIKLTLIHRTLCGVPPTSTPGALARRVVGGLEVVVVSWRFLKT